MSTQLLVYRSLSVSPEAAELQSCSLDVTAGELARLGAVLSGDERARAARFRFERDRRRFIAARGLLRLLLGERLEVAPASITFRYGRWGKPEVDGVYFNVAHSEDLALFAFSASHPVGCDIERIRDVPELPAIVSGWFAPRECAAILDLEPKAGLDLFFRYWTLKEAILKAAGTGLTVLSREFELQPDGDAQWSGLGRWTARACAAPAGYHAALAFPRGEGG